MSIFPKRWAPAHPDRIQLYVMPTPNGQKAGIVLEELELPYEAHRIDIHAGDQFDPEYVKINPNSKIPAIIDPNGPDGEPLTIMESGAILHYLARKTGRLMPTDPVGENQALQWLFFQVGSIGPMFGQFGHFSRVAKGRTDDYGEHRYEKEVHRLLGVVERQLEGREWILGTYSVVDISMVPWMQAMHCYKGQVDIGLDDYPNVHAWVNRFLARPAVQRGMKVGSA